MTDPAQEVHAALDEARKFERRQRDDQINAQIVQSERIDTALRSKLETHDRD